MYLNLLGMTIMLIYVLFVLWVRSNTPYDESVQKLCPRYIYVSIYTSWYQMEKNHDGEQSLYI